MRRRIACIIVSASLAGVANAAHADVKISSAATSSMACSAGVCAPTASKAVLNVSDLENMLASGNVEVTTTGSGVQATGIQVDAPLAWSSTNTLALDAYESITVEKPVTISSLGGLSVTANDGGRGGIFWFGDSGHVIFANLSSALTINAEAYTLVSTPSELAFDIVANPDGDYAFANDYNAKGDGKYLSAVVTADFLGKFDGLGNIISNVSIKRGSGFFAENHGSIYNARLTRTNVRSTKFAVREGIGGLVGENWGLLSGDFASGTISGSKGAYVGGLVGENQGEIEGSNSAGRVSGGREAQVGGLVGYNAGGSISSSFSESAVTGGNGSLGGGLVGNFYGTVLNSYATGSVTSYGSDVGGLLGASTSDVSLCYSIGSVANSNGTVGGSIGYNEEGQATDVYWDTTTSGTDTGVGRGSDSGVTGQMTEQLQSRLPSGFDPTIWAEDPNVNGGLPYLINNPPPKK